MSQLDWYKDEFTMIEEFSKQVLPLMCQVEGQKAQIDKLKSQKAEFNNQDTDKLHIKIQLDIITNTIDMLEKDNIEKLTTLQKIKESYIAEEIINAFETLTSIEEGMEVSEAGCDLMKRMNDLIREAGIEQHIY